MGVDFRFQIGVPRSQFELAKQAAGGAVEEPEDLGELKEDSAPRIETEHDHKRNSADYLKHWSPQDATMEICSKPSADNSSTIERSLTENLIHFRVDTDNTGTHRLFVRPEDEARAREILRQIEKGEPPQP